SGNDHFLDGIEQVFRGIGSLGEEASGFDDDLRADRGPIDLRRVALRKDAEFVAIDDDAIVGGANVGFVVAEHGVVFQQVRQRLGAGDVVDGDEVEVSASQCRAKHVAPDSSKSINTNFDCHLY